jgi:hypothetical protein
MIYLFNKYSKSKKDRVNFMIFFDNSFSISIINSFCLKLFLNYQFVYLRKNALLF